MVHAIMLIGIDTPR